MLGFVPGICSNQVVRHADRDMIVMKEVYTHRSLEHGHRHIIPCRAIGGRIRVLQGASSLGRGQSMVQSLYGGFLGRKWQARVGTLSKLRVGYFEYFGRLWAMVMVPSCLVIAWGDFGQGEYWLRV